MSKTFSKIRYNGSEEIFETIIKDGTGRTLGKWKCMKKDYGKVLLIIKEQYGLNLYIREFGRGKEETKPDKDLDWAR